MADPFDPFSFLRPRQVVTERPGPALFAPAAPAAEVADPAMPAPQFGVSSGPSSFDRFRDNLAGGMGGGSMTAQPAAASTGVAGPQDWDAFRSIIGQDVAGRRASAPQIFNRGPATGQMVEQSPLETIPQPRALTMDEELRRVDASGRNADVQARLRNEVITRHNLNRELLNEQQNAGRGLYSPTSRESIGRWGDPSRGGGGTEQMTAGANVTRAGADRTQANTGAATLEAATTPAARRLRFMSQLPAGTTPAQAAQLANLEEARGAFSGGGLDMGAVLGSTPPAPGAAAVTSFFKPGTPAANLAGTSYASLAPNLDAIHAGLPASENSLGAFLSRLNRDNAGMVQNNPAAIRAYLQDKFGTAAYNDALSGVRMYPGGPIRRGSGLGAIAQPFRALGSMLTGGSDWTPDLEGRSLAQALERMVNPQPR